MLTRGVLNGGDKIAYAFGVSMRFTRDAAGRVNGFLLDAGRIRNVKFWKEMATARPSTDAPSVR